jgi:hypothetical protein
LPSLIAFYGVICFVGLLVHELLPKGLARKIYQASYTYTEYLFFAILFWFTLKNKTVRWLIVVFSFGFLIFQVIYFITTPLAKLDSIPIFVETILLFFYIIYFFYEFSKGLSAQYIYNNYCFWIAVGILIYLGGSFFFYLSINHLTDSEIDTFGNLTYMAEIIKNVMFGLAVYTFTRHRYENSNKKSNSLPFLDMI